METVLYVSRIGKALEAKHLTVSRLQERLAGHGHRVSRGALTRLVSDEPIEEVRLSVIRPVLDELGMTFESAFHPIERADVDNRRRTTSEAKRLAGLSDSRTPAEDSKLADPRVELGNVIARSIEQIRASHPEVVDRRGRIRRRALARVIRDQLGDTRALTSDEYSRLIAPGLMGSAATDLLRDSDA